MMTTRHAGEHPSNRLSSGHVADCAEALELVEQEYAYERLLTVGRQGASAEDGEELRRMDESHAQIGAATGPARRLWQEEQEAARLRTVDRLRADALAAEAALDDEASRWLGLLVEALEGQDYSGLAI